MVAGNLPNLRGKSNTSRKLSELLSKLTPLAEVRGAKDQEKTPWVSRGTCRMNRLLTGSGGMFKETVSRESCKAAKVTFQLRTEGLLQPARLTGNAKGSSSTDIRTHAKNMALVWGAHA